MITMVILLWIASALNAPTWIYILGGIGVLLKLCASFMKMCWEAYRFNEV